MWGILVPGYPYRNPDTQYGSKGNQGTHEFALFKRGHLNLPGEMFTLERKERGRQIDIDRSSRNSTDEIGQNNEVMTGFGE